MSKKKNVEIEVEVDESEEIELSQEVINQFSKEIQTAINIVVDENIEKDIRIELINVLMSISSQLSIDVGIGEDEFMSMSEFFFQEGQKIVEEDKVDISTLN